jgi:DNA-binding GntR family transcriptional regulator
MSAATAQEVVAAALRQAILDRELKPGEKVRQEEMARRLGVSVIPVREALRVLAGEGQVTYRPRQGYVVAQLDLGDLEEVYRLREILEAEAVRVGMPRLAADDVLRIESLFEDVSRALEEGRIGDAMKANRRAHFALFEAAGMPILLRHIATLWDSTEAYRALYYSEAPRRERVDAEHREIAEALRARDENRVLELLDAHRRHALGALAAALAPEWDRPVPS